LLYLTAMRRKDARRRDSATVNLGKPLSGTAAGSLQAGPGWQCRVRCGEVD
jgi:hypothetical protein